MLAAAEEQFRREILQRDEREAALQKQIDEMKVVMAQVHHSEAKLGRACTCPTKFSLDRLWLSHVPAGSHPETKRSLPVQFLQCFDNTVHTKATQTPETIRKCMQQNYKKYHFQNPHLLDLVYWGGRLGTLGAQLVGIWVVGDLVHLGLSW